jgi:hypothetical protein
MVRVQAVGLRATERIFRDKVGAPEGIAQLVDLA